LDSIPFTQDRSTSRDKVFQYEILYHSLNGSSQPLTYLYIWLQRKIIRTYGCSVRSSVHMVATLDHQYILYGCSVRLSVHMVAA